MKYNITRKPFASASTFFDDPYFDDVINNFLGLRDYSTARNQRYDTVPKANIVETETGYTVALAAPGFTRDEFELSFDNNTLTVSVNTEDTETYEKSVRLREYKFEKFSRSWTLPENTKPDGITARYDAGILYIQVPVENNKQKGKQYITVE